MRKGKCIYALYKGDRFIDLGTISELANLLNVGEQYIGRLATPVYRNTIKIDDGKEN